MEGFMIQFLICNAFICIIIGMLLAVKNLLKNILTKRIQYNLWFTLLGLLAVPFVPFETVPFLIRWDWLGTFRKASAYRFNSEVGKGTSMNQPGTTDWMNDFGMELSRKTPSGIELALCTIWFIGMIILTILTLKSMIRFNRIRKSALPLQNPIVNKLYCDCLKETNITKNIPIYSTAFLKSPIIIGFLKPYIYLPIHLISDSNVNEIRYMLLHEIQHYKHRDALINYLMTMAGIIYWFNPFIWYALKEMKNDGEVACDTSVLKMLKKENYEDYGITLINFAEKISRLSFPFTAGISGNMVQMKKRILNITDYRPATNTKRLYSFIAYIIVGIFLLGLVPIMSIQAADHNQYYFNENNKDITYIDLADSFGKSSGSFVLYDSKEDSWKIYNIENAKTRIPPISTYKIYSALFALESGIISKKQSLITWDGQPYKHNLWNMDQTLESAMQNSVTWYFQAIDQQTDLASIQDYVQTIEYGNQTIGGDLSSYWADSSLKISPIEQVELLRKFYYNQFGFLSENIDTVKNAIYLYPINNCPIYGKTGTEERNGQNNSGWFIGYIEKADRTYFFATTIQNEELATGSMAAELTMSILSDLKCFYP